LPVVAKRAREKTMSLLREIQNLASADGDVVTVLRKCKILAARLASDEFANWVKWELDGYPEAQPTPEYRRLSVTYYARLWMLRGEFHRRLYRSRWSLKNTGSPFST
jgi:hypothetical protein